MVKRIKAVSPRVALIALVLAFSLVSLGSSSAFATGASISPASQRVCVGRNANWNTSWSGTPFYRSVDFSTNGDNGGYSLSNTYAASRKWSDSYGGNGSYSQSLNVEDYYANTASAGSSVNVGGSGCPSR